MPSSFPTDAGMAAGESQRQEPLSRGHSFFYNFLALLFITGFVVAMSLAVLGGVVQLLNFVDVKPLKLSDHGGWIWAIIGVWLFIVFSLIKGTFHRARYYEKMVSPEEELTATPEAAVTKAPQADTTAAPEEPKTVTPEEEKAAASEDPTDPPNYLEDAIQAYKRQS